MNCEEEVYGLKAEVKALEDVVLKGKTKKEEEARDTGRMARQEGKESRNAGFHGSLESRNMSEVEGEE